MWCSNIYYLTVPVDQLSMLDLASFSALGSLSAAAAKSTQSCLTLCDLIDGSSPGSPVPGILQARTLEWVAISFSNAGKWKVKVKSLSHVWLLATPWTAAYQAPPSMGFSRQEYWSGLPLPSPKLIKHKSLQTRYILLRYFVNLGTNSKILTILNCMRLISLCISLKYSVIG